MHFFARAPFWTDTTDVTDDQHPGYKFGIVGWTIRVAVASAIQANQGGDQCPVEDGFRY